MLLVIVKLIIGALIGIIIADVAFFCGTLYILTILKKEISDEYYSDLVMEYYTSKRRYSSGLSRIKTDIVINYLSKL